MRAQRLTIPLPAPTRIGSSTLLHRNRGTQNCWACFSVKPLADFNPSQIARHLCRECSRERVRQYAKNNPEKRREINERYRKTPRGKKAYYRRHKAWRSKNDWCDRERARRESAGLTDFYIKTLLKKRGVKDPTSEQIITKRRYIQTLRARRTIALMTYGARIQD
jgi:hypothetical protein